MGWIKLDRSISSHWIWGAKPFDEAHAWLDLLLMANWKDSKRIYKGELIEQRRGEVVTTIKGLSDRWGWYPRKVREFLKALEADYMIFLTSSTHGTRIQIANWLRYQSVENPSESVPTSDTEIPTTEAIPVPTKCSTKYRPSTDQVPQQKKEKKEKNSPIPQQEKEDIEDEAKGTGFVPMPEELKDKLLNGFKM